MQILKMNIVAGKTSLTASWSETSLANVVLKAIQPDANSPAIAVTGDNIPTPAVCANPVQSGDKEYVNSNGGGRIYLMDNMLITKSRMSYLRNLAYPSGDDPNPPAEDTDTNPTGNTTTLATVNAPGTQADGKSSAVGSIGWAIAAAVAALLACIVL